MSFRHELRSLFLSTPSARRATEVCCWDYVDKMISIHALREEGDPTTIPFPNIRQISIHALREEGDLQRQQRRSPALVISIHALREEGDPRRHHAC